MFLSNDVDTSSKLYDRKKK